MKPSLSTTIFAFAIGIGGIVFLGIIAHNLLQHHKATGFEKVSGNITRSEIVKSRGIKVTQPTIETPTIEYQYTVDGKTYVGHLYSFVRRAWKNEELEQYPLGREVTVYYDPTHPETSVLSRSNDPFFYDSMLLIFPGLFLFCLTLLVGIIGDRQRAAAPKVGFLLLHEDGTTKTLKYPMLPPITVGILAYSFACFCSLMVTYQNNIVALTIALAVASVFVGVAAYFLYAKFCSTRPTLIIDTLQKTFSFHDLRTPSTPLTVPFDRVDGFDVSEGFNESSKMPTCELSVRYRDDKNDPMTAQLIFLKAPSAFLEEPRAWLEHECSGS